MTLDQIKERCVIDDITGCWEFRGALTKGKYPRIWAPDYSRAGGEKRSQSGTRAVWHIVHQKSIKSTYRVYTTCMNTVCLNPDHMKCGPTKNWGDAIRSAGIFRNRINRVLANVKSGKLRQALSTDLQAQILIRGENESGASLAREFGVSRSTVSRILRREVSSFPGIGGIFSGLLR